MNCVLLSNPVKYKELYCFGPPPRDVYKDSLYFTKVLDFVLQSNTRVKQKYLEYSWKNIRDFYIVFGTTRSTSSGQDKTDNS